MADQVEFITLNEGEKTECEARIHVIEGVSITLDLMDFSRNPSVAEILAFAEETFKTVIDDTLNVHPRLHFQISASAHMETVNGERVAFVEISNKSVFLYRHKHNRERVIREQFVKISNPQHHAENYGDVQIENDTSGSSFAFPTAIDQIRLSLITPLHYNPRALSTSLRLKAGQKFAKHLDVVPYNGDKYCFLHCVFQVLYEAPAVKQFRNLNLHKEYSACFTEFLKENKLEDFYSGDNFLIDDVTALETRLKCSINVFRESAGEIELYYRSNFRYGAGDPLNILLLPLSVFENTREDGAQPSPNCEAIRQAVDLENKTFLGKISTMEFVNTLEAHAVVLNSSFFRAYKGGVVCKYCHCTKDRKIDISIHEQNCLQLHRGIPLRERVRNYKECKAPRKVFDRYSAFYRVPFCTYDFETRIVKTTDIPGGKVVNRHVPYSFSILYVNVFNLADSKVFLEKNLDPKALIQKFVSICKDLTRYHHDEVQSVDHAVNRPRLTKEIREAGCPWCLESFDREKRAPEYNHSHFQADILNLEHNRYICKACNQKCKIRDKPLKFFAHNASKYDQQLFLPTFLNDIEIKTHSFLNKSESRFTEVRLGFGYVDFCGNSRYKLSFNNSLMLLSDTLAKNCAAWISQSDRESLATLMGLFYKDIPREALKPLVDLSFKKQVFPYSALNEESLLESVEPIPQEYFANTFLMDAACSEGDYQEYLKANETLGSVLGGSTFGDYHDLYLLLDCVLLGIILHSFQNLNSNLSGLNPLAFLSTSAYSFNALLKHNKYSQVAIPEIIIPEVDVQRFVRRGIKGGFTQIFNKTNLKGAYDLSFGSDFTSLYPTIMSKCKLPYQFHRWLPTEGKTVETIISEMEGLEDMYYFVDCDIAALAPEFQEKVSNYPMFPETQTISADDYSEDQVRRSALSSGCEYFTDQTLNTTSFYPKTGYVCSWSYLKQAIEVGYRVEKINRVAVFHAAPIMSDYINEVYKLKETATTERNKTPVGTPEYDAISSRIAVYKLILNGIYGFTIVNSDSHKEADLLDVEKERTVLHRRVSSPRFIGMLRVGDKVVVNQMKTSYTLEYPLAIGAAILWESKLLTAQYVFTLFEWLKTLGELKLHPLFFDTDSIYVSIAGFRKEFKSIEDFCSRFNKECYPIFDTCDFSTENQIPETHNALGYMTLEAGGCEITDFAGVAAKCYSYQYGEKSVTKGKGISRALQAQHLNFPLYQGIVDGSILEDFSREKYSCSFREFRNTGFNIETRDSAKCYATLVDLKTYNVGGKDPEWAVFGSEKHKALLALENL